MITILILGGDENAHSKQNVIENNKKFDIVEIIKTTNKVFEDVMDNLF